MGIQKCPEKNLPGPTRHTGHLSLRGKITQIKRIHKYKSNYTNKKANTQIKNKKYTNTKVSGEESAWSDSAHGPSFTERQNNTNKKIHKYKSNYTNKKANIHKYKSVRRRICLVRLGTRAISH